MGELISVIIPVYKVEKYLDQCMESIVGQSYRNLEIILVEDGSPDRCSEMCDLWGKRDKRIKVIHQENAGGGMARNRGLDIAKGEFIAFVDSDDYIAPTMLEFLHSQFEKDIDIVECGYCIVQDETISFRDEKELFKTQTFLAEDAMRENIKDHIFRQIIWNKMYRRNVIEKIRFPLGRKIDDEFWTYQVIGNARKLVWTDRTLYAYRQQKDSVMHSLRMDQRFEAIEAKIKRHTYICEKMPMLEAESFLNLWSTCLYQGQYLLKMEDKKERQRIWRQLKMILQKYPIKGEIPTISKKKKIWLEMETKLFYLTCRIRNILKIGL